MNEKAKAVIDYCNKNVGAAYIYGATGRLCTKEYRKARIAQYPEFRSAIVKNCPALNKDHECFNTCRYFNKSAFDCAQLVRRAFQKADINLPSGATSQWLKSDWAFKGPVDIKAKETLCVLFRTGGNLMKHAGVSLGDGYVVDARGHSEGVIKSAFESYPWTHYAVPKGLDAEFGNAENTIDIKKIQEMLINSGFPLPRFGADGRFGKETKSAMQNYQKSRGINISNLPDAATYSALLNEEKPVFVRLTGIEKRLKKLEEKNI